MDKLSQLLTDTDALTYINALRVTLLELKAEFSTIEEMQEYTTQACERSKKLMRKADNQYRLVAKLVNKEPTIDGRLDIDDTIEELQEIEELMSNE